MYSAYVSSINCILHIQKNLKSLSKLKIFFRFLEKNIASEELSSFDDK